MVAWSLPLILTITTMALGEIDGDYVTGICFVGMVNASARAGFLLLPLAIAMIMSGYITVKGRLYCKNFVLYLQFLFRFQD